MFVVMQERQLWVCDLCGTGFRLLDVVTSTDKCLSLSATHCSDIVSAH